MDSDAKSQAASCARKPDFEKLCPVSYRVFADADKKLLLRLRHRRIAGPGGEPQLAIHITETHRSFRRAAARGQREASRNNPSHDFPLRRELISNRERRDADRRVQKRIAATANARRANEALQQGARVETLVEQQIYPWPIFIVRNSRYAKWFYTQASDALDKDGHHYHIAAMDEIVDVISARPPVISWLNDV